MKPVVATNGENVARQSVIAFGHSTIVVENMMGMECNGGANRDLREEIKVAIREEKVTPKLPEYSFICHLVKTAFLRNEQFPLWVLRLLALRERGNFRAFYDGEQFCGILYTAENDKYIFVLYLAVNDKIRSKGYGSQILQWLKGITSKIIVLNVEATNLSAVNSLQREKRIAFYQKNGITDTGYTFVDAEEKYSVLSSDSERFDVQEYGALLKWFSLGVYRKNISQR